MGTFDWNKRRVDVDSCAQFEIRVIDECLKSFKKCDEFSRTVDKYDFYLEVITLVLMTLRVTLIPENTFIDIATRVFWHFGLTDDDISPCIDQMNLYVKKGEKKG